MGLFRSRGKGSMLRLGPVVEVGGRSSPHLMRLCYLQKAFFRFCGRTSVHRSIRIDRVALHMRGRSPATPGFQPRCARVGTRLAADYTWYEARCGSPGRDVGTCCGFRQGLYARTGRLLVVLFATPAPLDIHRAYWREYYVAEPSPCVTNLGSPAFRESG